MRYDLRHHHANTLRATCSKLASESLVSVSFVDEIAHSSVLAAKTDASLHSNLLLPVRIDRLILLRLRKELSCEKCAVCCVVGKVVCRSVVGLRVDRLLIGIISSSRGRLRLIVLRRGVVLVFMIGSEVDLGFVVSCARVCLLIRGAVLLVGLCEKRGRVSAR